MSPSHKSFECSLFGAVLHSQLRLELQDILRENVRTTCHKEHQRWRYNKDVINLQIVKKRLLDRRHYPQLAASLTLLDVDVATFLSSRVS